MSTRTGLALAMLLLTASEAYSQADTSITRAPVLDFPEAGLDDTAAYQGYQTRFYRDSRENTVQIYLRPESGRVVLLWADAANESVGFTVRSAKGQPVRLSWAGDSAEVTGSGKDRTIEFRLRADAGEIELGWFLLGSMRVERDFQYARRHFRPFTASRFRVAEESLLVAALARLPADVRGRHLAILGADSIAELRSRLQPAIAGGSASTIRIEQPSLDDRNRLLLELSVEPEVADIRGKDRTLAIASRSGAPVEFTVRVTTDAAPLTPLVRARIFNQPFLEFLERERADSAAVTRYRRLERQVRAVELLSSEEKLMAGLPNFATYFGRDMMVSALMMRPIWSPDMAEHVIGSVLRKLGPDAEVSHEEALAGQAIRENAVVYDSLITQYRRVARAGQLRRADAILTRAAQVLRELNTTRENYHMIDDEFQLPVLVAGYVGDSAVPAPRKREFLLESVGDRGSRLELMLRELALVASWTRPYVDDPRPANLISFPRRDSVHWRSSSWRDSDAGYGGGRFAMDVNVIWVPGALEATAAILAALPALGVDSLELDSVAPEIRRSPLRRYARDRGSLDTAIAIWRGARKHFTVRLAPAEMRRRIAAGLGRLDAAERSYWQRVLASEADMSDSLEFLALALDARGRPIPVVNTDPATDLFLRDFNEPAQVLQEVEPFMRPYPVGLFVEKLGPLVANDVYAAPRIGERFRADPYHGPRVVWGREVNLFLLGLARQIQGAPSAAHVEQLGQALQRTLEAVDSSGLAYNELWSYRIEGGRLLPIRYGAGSDIQLWNTTDLAVEFVLSRLTQP